MKTIPLTQGYVALVDNADFEAVNAFKWHVFKSRRRVYAKRNVRQEDGKWTGLLLHRFLIPGTDQIDHRDGDGLNNQRHNLRPASNQQNHRGSCRKKPGASSAYRGVSWYSSKKKFVAEIKTADKRLRLGYFSDEIEAARAYDAAARKYFGEFASPNFP